MVHLHTRLGLSTASLPDPDVLGPLADLAGTWVGGGFNLISLPDFDSRPPSTGPRAFRLKLNATIETLQFIPYRWGRAEPGLVDGFWQHHRTARYFASRFDLPATGK
jgi:hypothetical protein